MTLGPSHPIENPDRYVKSGGLRVTPWGFSVRAREFLDASVLLSAKSGRFSFVAAFLSCRAIELGLKAYLLSQGHSVSKVTRLGHDLIKALDESKARGIGSVVAFTASDRKFLNAVNEDYKGNNFAYFDVQSAIEMPRNPDLHLLPSIAQRLLDGIDEAGKTRW